MTQEWPGPDPFIMILFIIFMGILYAIFKLIKAIFNTIIRFFKKRKENAERIEKLKEKIRDRKMIELDSNNYDLLKLKGIEYRKQRQNKYGIDLERLANIAISHGIGHIDIVELAEKDEYKKKMEIAEEERIREEEEWARYWEDRMNYG